MSLFTNIGATAARSAEKEPMKFIKLEDGKFIRVRVVSMNAVAEYLSHGDFNLNIFPTPCIAANGDGCPLCTASKAGIEAFEKLYAKPRFLFFFYDIDAGAFLPFDATKQQAKSIISDMKQYEESLGDIAFTFKRTGTSTSTKYTLSPILKLSADDTAKFNAMPQEGITPAMWENALIVRDKSQMIADLEKAGFPVAEFFPPVPFAATNGDINP